MFKATTAPTRRPGTATWAAAPVSALVEVAPVDVELPLLVPVELAAEVVGTAEVELPAEVVETATEVVLNGVEVVTGASEEVVFRATAIRFGFLDEEEEEEEEDSSGVGVGVGSSVMVDFATASVRVAVEDTSVT
jgi:hypothetical protein